MLVSCKCKNDIPCTHRVLRDLELELVEKKREHSAISMTSDDDDEMSNDQKMSTSN